MDERLTMKWKMEDCHASLQQCKELLKIRLDLEMPPIQIRFDLVNRIAGQAIYQTVCAPPIIRLNPYMLLHEEDFIETTVPHEVAHHAVFFHYRGQRVKPHGREWKHMMWVLGAEPHTCHQYDTSFAPKRRTIKYEAQCKCQTFWITAHRVNRMKKGRAYFCKLCKGFLHLTGSSKKVSK